MSPKNACVGGYKNNGYFNFVTKDDITSSSQAVLKTETQKNYFDLLRRAKFHLTFSS